MNNSKEIERIKQKIIPLLKEHRVAKAGIFGSYARGEQKKRSDVDVLIEIPENWSLFELAALKRVLKKRLGRKVDLVGYEGIRKELKRHILNDEIPIIR